MKKIILGFILGGIVFTLGGVVATTAISSTNVTYQNKTVNSALNELYNEATTGKELVAAAITNKGITTTSNDTYETMANNINSIDTDHTEINQKINNLESKHNSDVASLTGSISNLNQSLTNIFMFNKILLWTNPSPTSEFSAQELQLDLSTYKFIIMIVKGNNNASNTDYFEYAFSEKNIPLVLECGYESVYDTNLGRTLVLSDTGIRFDNANMGSGGAVSNNTVIPYKIYGVK